ncbi:MAG: hypothetical protein KF866_00390 [Phycisphaeraceae bacterium]|nr:hypothetical protein [Phycisphaeraceae bacterium]MCW5753620.1 hypothetical protein [Phycisphaeraceae bacterium]
MTDAPAVSQPASALHIAWSRVAIRWSITLSALLVVGPLVGRLTGSLRNVDGSIHATPLVSLSPLTGMLGALVGVVAACTLGAVGGRWFGPRFALRTAGFVLCWAAWRTGTMDEILRTAQGSTPLRSLALEGLVLGAAVLVGVYLMLRCSRPVHAAEREEFGSGHSRHAMGVFVLASALAVVVGAAGAGFAGWLIAVEPLKGQAIFAAFFGGIAAGAFGRLAGSLICERVSPMALVGGIVVAAIVAPLTPLIFQSGAVMDRAYAGTLFKAAYVLPLDWLGGGLVGVPIGIAWVGSMMDKGPAKTA